MLCTTLSRDTDGVRVRTVEHLLSALEATGVDNCGIQMVAGDEVGARTLFFFFQYLTTVLCTLFLLGLEENLGYISLLLIFTIV